MKYSALFFFLIIYSQTAFSNQISSLSDLLVYEQWALKNATRLSPVDNTTPIGTCHTKPAINNGTYTCNGYVAPGSPSIDVNAEAGWSLFSGLPLTQGDVVVGLIDTGVDYHHPDLAAHIWINPNEIINVDGNNNGIDDGCEDGIDKDANGYIDDCHGINAIVEKNINGNPNPIAGDPIDSAVGHGTNMAGVIAATGNNGLSSGGTFHGGVVGIAGLSSNVKIATCAAAELVSDAYVTVPNLQGLYATPEAVTACLEYFSALKESGINIAVINGSGGASAFNNLNIARGEIRSKYLLNTPAVEAALLHLNTLNIPVVTATGNNGWNIDHDPETMYYPAAFQLENIISVTAINNQGERWGNASFGRWSVDLAAPGESILSTNPRLAITGTEAAADYVVSSGTSQATAFISGVVALLKANTTTASLSPIQIKRLLLSSGKSLESLEQTTRSGKLVQLSGNQASGALNCSNQLFQRRSHPQQDNLFRTPGETIYLEVHSYLCEAPSNAIKITVTVSPTGELVDLYDTGISPDKIANDGIYSGDWIVPSVIVDYQLNTGIDSVTQEADILNISAKIIVDNASSETHRSGWWWPSIYRSGFYAHNYRYAGASSSTERVFTWKPDVPVAGYYDVYTTNPAHSNFATNASFHVHHQAPGDSGTQTTTTYSVDQTTLSGQWKLLGRHWFDQGSQSIDLSNLNADGTVIADAIMLQYGGSTE